MSFLTFVYKEAHLVRVDKVEELPHWKPRIGSSKTNPEKTPAVLLSGSVERDTSGKISTSESETRKALTTYMELTYGVDNPCSPSEKKNHIFSALVPGQKNRKRRRTAPPPWNVIARTDVANYIDPNVLPPGFVFDDPERLKTKQLFELAAWILQGENGELPKEKRFRWLKQDDSSAPTAPTVYVLYSIYFSSFNLFLQIKHGWQAKACN
jgi:hypothetical protein